MFDEVRGHLREMLEIGAIREFSSPYSSNLVLVRKSDGSLRLYIDNRGVNRKTIKDAHSLPRIEDTLDCLLGTLFFTKLDLRSPYWKCAIKESDKPKTAFNLGPLGFYELNRLPFDLTNACSTFQRLMERCMGELHLKECLIYLDNIIIFSKTEDEHIKRLESVFRRLKEHNLKLRGKKCEFFKTEIKYLGLIVLVGGIKTDPEKVSVVKNWPAIKNVKDLRNDLGFTSYYRRFIQDYAKIVKPLNDLLIGHTTKKDEGKK
jgi:hypothetical protein